MNEKVLVLIVGTNPLPNYVVGSHLKEKYDKFVLIISPFLILFGLIIIYMAVFKPD